MRFTVPVISLLLYILKAQLVTSAGRNQTILCKAATNIDSSHFSAVEARELTGLVNNYKIVSEED